MVRRHVHITEKQNEILNRYTKDSGLKWAELLRRIIDEFIKRLKCQSQKYR